MCVCAGRERAVPASVCRHDHRPGADAAGLPQPGPVRRPLHHVRRLPAARPCPPRPSPLLQGPLQGSGPRRPGLSVRHDQSVLSAGEICRIRPDDALGSGKPSRADCQGEAVAAVQPVAQGPVVRSGGDQAAQQDPVPAGRAARHTGQLAHAAGP